MKSFSILVITIVSLSVSHATGAEKLTLDSIFPRDRVLDVQITVAEEDWDTIRVQRRNFQSALAPERQFGEPESPYTYVKAKVSIDGVVYPEVGLRKKGFIGSQSSTRPSLKIKLNHVNKKENIEGLSMLTFNNNRQDRTHMSQVLGYDLFNKMGSPAPRCCFAKITVNGESLGIYSHVESARKPMVDRAFGNNTGTFYEGTVTDFFPEWGDSFDRKFGNQKTARKKIQKLIDALQEPEGNSILRETATGRALVPTNSDVEKTWMTVDFDDSRWKSGRNGAGFESQEGYHELISKEFNFQEEMYQKNATVYLRFPFEIDDPQALQKAGRLLLQMKYDDGFVAYLNGQRIASANVPEELAWDSTATGGHDDSVAVRFQSFDISEHRDKFRKGTNLLAIQAMNVSAASTDMLCVARITMSNYNCEEAIGGLVELDAFYKFWAVEGLLGFWDGYSGNRNNFFLYLNPKTDKFHFLPWGADSLFVKYTMLRRTPGAPLSVKTNGLIAHKLYQTAAGRERYAKAMRLLLEEHWDEEKLIAEVDRLAKLIKPHLTENQAERFEVESTKTFIKTRKEEILAEMKGGMPIWSNAPSPPPVIQTRPRNQTGNENPRTAGLNADTLRNAARKGDVEALKRHLETGADVNGHDEQGDTPLSMASLGGHVDAVKFLIEKKANVNQKTREGNAPLHLAAFLGHIEVVKLLVANGATVNQTNNGNETALDIAAIAWDDVEEIVEFVIDTVDLKLSLKDVKAGRESVTNFLRENGGQSGEKLKKEE